MERPGQWAAHPQPRMWYYAGPPYGSPGMQHSGVPYRALSTQYVPWPLAALPAHTSHPAASPWEIAQTSHRAAQPCHIGSQPTAQPEQKRELDPTYCMVDEKTGDLKSLASISQVSGAKYEGMISQMFCTSGPRELRAVTAQRPEERERLEKCRAKVEEFLQKQLPGPFANRMNTRGVGEELAEIDAVHTGSFKAFAEKNNKLGKVVVAADADVEIVLVEICSDSRFVAKKLYQIEIQSSLVKRSGYLVRDNEHDWEPIHLQPRTTGFAIVFNRAALSIDTQRLARDCQLTNVLGLLEDNKLHILYFSSEEALPAALARATEAQEKAEMALRRLEQGSTSASTVVWVIELIRKDKQLTAEEFEPKGNAFQVKGALSNVDDLKEGIKNKAELSIPSFKIDIYSKQGRKWVKEDEDNEVNRGASKADSYGFVVPSADDA